MHKIALVIGSLAILSGCGPNYEQQKSDIKTKLPEGCEFFELGPYGEGRVVAVRCDGYQTTTNYIESYYQNKTYYTRNNIAYWDDSK